ncbi:hypothetical protein B9Z55_016587 [Caenorhabditis nigoni]|uniref:Uncharacterized protein n=1 Tax=Caenorhabditis nigoni TaxID=1611254 RepID=A0A2G5T5W7_9PELO|nr:hypothetical protein B9Z55_016587 [Caenorhabditis nigoni]
MPATVILPHCFHVSHFKAFVSVGRKTATANRPPAESVDFRVRECLRTQNVAYANTVWHVAVEVLTYFPSNSQALLKSEQHGSQLGANTFFVGRTEYAVEIFKWWILCALDKTCMNPPGAQVLCSFKEDRNKEFANCFRFDQSILNLLMLNHYQDHLKYFTPLGLF